MSAKTPQKKGGPEVREGGEGSFCCQNRKLLFARRRGGGERVPFIRTQREPSTHAFRKIQASHDERSGTSMKLFHATPRVLHDCGTHALRLFLRNELSTQHVKRELSTKRHNMGIGRRHQQKLPEGCCSELRRPKTHRKRAHHLTTGQRDLRGAASRRAMAFLPPVFGTASAMITSHHSRVSSVPHHPDGDHMRDPPIHLYLVLSG